MKLRKLKLGHHCYPNYQPYSGCHCLPHTNTPSLFQNWNYGILFTFKEVFIFHLLKKPLKNLGIVTTNDGHMLNSI